MNRVSKKRTEWLASYRWLLNNQIPTECARCAVAGKGWRHFGGDFEPHHPFARRTRWATMTFIPLCLACHRWVHDHGKEARTTGWIVEPKHP